MLYENILNTFVSAINKKGGVLNTEASLKDCENAILNLSGGSSANIYKCATKWHPISWFGYGLCCPFKPGKGILIAEKTFKEGVNSLIEIIIHEFSHSSLGTIDGLYAKGIDSDKFEDRIKDAWVWTFII